MAFQTAVQMFSYLPSVRVLLAFFLTVLIIKWTLEWLCGPANLPPGPWGLPLLGANFRLGSNPGQSLFEMSKRYGKIFSLRIGPRLTVVITDPELVREAHCKKAEATSARDPSTLDWLDVSGSIISCSGSDVKPLRRFILRALRDFGLGKKSSERLIMEEAQHLCRALERTGKGTFFDPRNQIQMAVANIICTLCFGRRFDYASSELMQLVLSLQAVSHISGLSITREIPLLFLAPRFKVFREGGLTYRKIITDIVAQHKATFDPDHHRDVTDKLIQETSNEDSLFSFGDDRIYRTLIDMFGAGADTTSSVLQFALWHMALKPNVQKKVRSEILTAVGTERAPDLSDRPRLPYTQATVNEVLRLTHPVPLNLLHRTTASIELAGYDIPEGTELMTPIACMNMDPGTWKEPEEFDPERFLSKDGKSMVLPPGFLPFGTGSRMCLGKTLARSELFLFFATMMQRFTFDLPPKAPGSHSGYFGFFLWFPDHFKISATPNF
ncbi:cytochrome P450 2J6-like [Patiria miniata]|uniref:Cytochrome P450 n=1 Tax=Patiria miniata TaxID=46514 RepID=A0A913ZJF6_PATMI|nr:cytochrome P450 2J6-like [Patiria miniata]